MGIYTEIVYLSSCLPEIVWGLFTPSRRESIQIDSILRAEIPLSFN